MSKNLTLSKKKAAAPVKGQRTQQAAEIGYHSNRNMRETIESIAIAFILAFLFRTFEAEAFVIPTGSMAPTLQGRHKDVECSRCGYRFRASASSEEDERTRLYPIDREIVGVTCPICRYPMSVDPRYQGDDAEKQAGTEQPSYSGDRILVSKFAYEFAPPERWDVVVFKYPGDAKMNYIKRLVGLPGEDLKIYHGDIWTRPQETNDDFQIARKAPGKVRAMLQTVHDNHYIPAEEVGSRWPLRWQCWPTATADGWTSDVAVDDQNKVRQTFTINGQGDDLHWIRYQHFVPNGDDWQKLLAGTLPTGDAPKPQLVSDFYAYNGGETRADAGNFNEVARAQQAGLHWVGDLMLEADVEVESAAGELVLDLVQGGVHYSAKFDLATGGLTLSDSSNPQFAPTATTPLQTPGKFKVALANIDQQLFVWVDKASIEFSAPTTYENATERVPNQEDLSPAGVGARGATLRITGLRLLRDIYYIADTRGQPVSDYDQSNEPLSRLSKSSLAAFMSDPTKWEVFARRKSAEFPLRQFPDDPQLDQFLMLGDNSPASKDSRLWTEDRVNGHQLPHYVERELLIGKALCIYWPHSWFFPIPNFGDMGMVR